MAFKKKIVLNLFFQQMIASNKNIWYFINVRFQYRFLVSRYANFPNKIIVREFVNRQNRRQTGKVERQVSFSLSVSFRECATRFAYKDENSTFLSAPRPFTSGGVDVVLAIVRISILKRRFYCDRRGVGCVFAALFYRWYFAVEVNLPDQIK